MPSGAKVTGPVVNTTWFDADMPPQGGYEPRHMYKWTGESVMVGSEDEQAAAEEAGFKLEAPKKVFSLAERVALIEKTLDITGPPEEEEPAAEEPPAEEPASTE